MATFFVVDLEDFEIYGPFNDKDIAKEFANKLYEGGNVFEAPPENVIIPLPIYKQD